MQLVFDLDGVLLDSESDLRWLRTALDATLESVGIDVTPENRRRIAPGNLRVLPTVAKSWDLAPEKLWRVRNDHYLDVKLSAIDSGAIGPFRDVEAIEDDWLPTRHIISNSPEAVVEAFVDRNGFTGLFGERIGRGDGFEWLDRLKPARYFYEVLRTATDENDGYLYVGDTETDREFAERTGMDFYHVDRSEGRGLWALRERLEGGWNGT